MSMIDRKRLHKFYHIIASEQQMKLLRLMSNDKTYRYNDLKEMMGLKTKGNQAQSGKFAYHLRKLRINDLVKKEDGYYFMTRAGIALSDLLSNFEAKCMSYEMGECEKDGKLKHFVERIV
jgi:predicted transcriptional regulator